MVRMSSISYEKSQVLFTTSQHVKIRCMRGDLAVW